LECKGKGKRVIPERNGKNKCFLFKVLTFSPFFSY
jgi:hypothetical protein